MTIFRRREEIKQTRVTPAADYLLTVRDESEAKPLPEEQALSFHRTVAQVLYLAARSRHDIQPVTAFLTTQLRSPDEDDWGKLKRLIGYLKGTPMPHSSVSLVAAGGDRVPSQLTHFPQT